MDVKVVHFSESRFLGTQARELKGLVEAAGTDIVGVCLDSGNPVCGPRRRSPSYARHARSEPRIFNYANPDAWALYRNQPAWEFARFLALAEKGKPASEPPANPSSTPAARNLANVESSIRWTQAFLASVQKGTAGG